MKLIILSIFLFCFIGIDALDKQKDCRCRVNPLGRIANGRDAALHTYPWHVRIVELRGDKKLNQCAATILNENTLLSAASCFGKNNAVNLSNLRAVIKDREEFFEFEQIIKHPGFFSMPVNMGYVENDIAIIKLKNNITLSNLIQPGCLNLRHRASYNGIPLYAAGFGMRKARVIKPKSLRDEDFINEKFAETDLVDQSENLCPGEGEELLCVAARNGNNLCLGDSGTGILSNIKGRSYVVGVAGISHIKFSPPNIELCMHGNRGVKLSSYKNFIDQHVADNYCSQQ